MDDEQVITDEERKEFRKLRGRAEESLRALIFREDAQVAAMSAGAVSSRILEVSVLVNELFRERVPDGIRWQWSVADPELGLLPR